MREIADLSASIDGMKGLDNEKGSSARNVTASLKFSKRRSDKHPNAIEILFESVVRLAGRGSTAKSASGLSVD
jgi:hypothetical protein